MRLEDIDTIKKLAAEHERLNKLITALQNVLSRINIDVTYMGSGVKADHSFSSNSGLDMARLQAAMTVALNVELDEIQTKLALFGVEDFKRA